MIGANDESYIHRLSERICLARGLNNHVFVSRYAWPADHWLLASPSPSDDTGLVQEEGGARLQDQGLLVLAQLLQHNQATQDRFLEARVDPSFITCTPLRATPLMMTVFLNLSATPSSHVRMAHRPQLPA